MPLRPPQLARGGCGAGVDGLGLKRLKLEKIHRPVVQRAGQAETVIYQHRLARAIALVHATNLRDCHVRFIQHEQIIVREEIKQRCRPRTRRPAGNVARIVFDAGAETHFLHHFQIVFRPHLNALRLQQPAVPLEPPDALAQFLADGEDGAFHFVAGGHELFRRENHVRLERFQLVAGKRLEARQLFDVIAEKLHAQTVLATGGPDFHGIAAYPEIAALEGDVVARVLKVHESRKKLIAREFLPHTNGNDQRRVILLAADAVNAGHAGDHHHIPPAEERSHGGEPHPFDVIVDARILLNKRVRTRDVRLRLVIIEVTDKIFDRVFWEKALKLRVQLRRQSLVMRNDQRGLVDVLDDVGNRKGLARARHSEQSLVLHVGQDAFSELFNRRRLVAGGLVIGNEFKHG